MDLELLDLFSSDQRLNARRPHRRGKGDVRSRGAGDRAVTGRRGPAVPARSRDAASAEDALLALARTLSAEERAACEKRAQNRAFAGVPDRSDPCICGEAQLLAAAAGQGAGRAPLSAYRAIGGRA